MKESLGTVVIGVAIDEEYREVRKHLEGSLESEEDGGCLYQIGHFPARYGDWKVVLLQTGAGNTQAGVQIARAVDRYQPQLVLYVGVAGGVKDVVLGDVVAAESVYGYEEGKDTAADFEPRVKSFFGAYRLVQYAKKIARDDEWQHRIIGPVPEAQPRAVLGPIAAGSKVVADRDSGTAAFLRAACGDVLAVEMEGHGFLYSAYVTDIPGLVVRGVSDLLSGKTGAADCEWQPAAARHAAALAFELLSQLPPDDRAFQDDLAAVREVTAANRSALADHTTLPGTTERLSVERREFQTLFSADQNFVVTGEPGCGKSGALNRLARELDDRGEQVVLLTVDTLGPQSCDIREGVRLSRSLLAVLKKWPGEGRANLLIDGLDAARGGPVDWLVRVVAGLAGSRWRAIATMRQFDLRHSHDWRNVFAGPPVSAAAADTDLGRVRHFLLGGFSRDELALLAGRHPVVGSLVSGASEHLIDLVRNPFNLRLACELLESGLSRASLATTRDQLDLLQAYWRTRVEQHPDKERRLRVLTAITEEMLTRRALRASGSTVPDGLLDTRAGLVRDGVLAEVRSRLRAAGSQSVAYTHHILFDYSVAALIFAGDDDLQLVPRLRQDKNLVLVARPSIDLHLADLWHADDGRTMFAEVVAETARYADSLTGVAAVRVFVAEADAPADVQWLLDLASADVAVFSAVVGWLVGVLGLDDYKLRRQASDRIELWAAVLARATASLRARFDRTLANQTMSLLQQLDAVRPMAPGAVAAEVWAGCAAALMDIAVEDPAELEPLASAVVRFLPRAVAVDASLSGSVRSSLRAGISASWPPRYLYHLVDGAALIAGADPDLACDLLAFVLGAGTDSDEPLPLHEGVVSLTTTRRQDLEMAKHAVGTVIEEFIELAGLARAVDVVAAALPGKPEMPAYPLACRSARGQVDLFGPYLRYGPGHGVAATVVTAFAEALERRHDAEAELDPVVDSLVGRIRHPEAWTEFLAAAARRPAGLGHKFLPTLKSGALLAHNDTRHAAGALIRAVRPTLSHSEHHAVEQAVLAAPGLLPDPCGPGAEIMLDQLCGCLIADQIRDPSLAWRARRLADGEGPPEILPPQPPVGSIVPTTLSDYLGERDAEITNPEQRAALDALRGLLAAQSDTLASEDAAALKAALRRALDLGVTGADCRAPGAEIVFRAIERLIRASAPQPDSELAALVMPVLLRAAGQTDPPAAEGAQPLRSWSPTPARCAIESLARLWCSPGWRFSAFAEEMRTRLTAKLDDADPVGRLTASAVAHLLSPDEESAFSLVCELVVKETNPTVAAQLVGTLGRFLPHRVSGIDSLLGQLSEGAPWSTLAAGTGDDPATVDSLAVFTDLALHLAVRHRAPVATVLVTTWLTDNVETSAAWQTISQLRGWLELPASQEAERTRAFGFLRKAIEALNRLRDSADLDRQTRSYLTADHVADEIQFASETQAESGVDPNFAGEALSSLEGMTQFRHPSITHSMLEALGTLAVADPTRAFRVAAAAIDTGDRYTFDQLAAAQAIAFITRYLTEFRAHVVGDETMLSAVRSVLNSFVDAGWPSAIALAYRLSELFR
ncbi:hypothetical protein [Amycolatopsis sp. GA6-003]|uniref:phosphorylase family protein n=1 Tax=Amycolatopsis sp. GA6-003 TaxID=2652444 RepID=UPI003916EAA0